MTVFLIVLVVLITSSSATYFTTRFFEPWARDLQTAKLKGLLTFAAVVTLYIISYVWVFMFGSVHLIIQYFN